MCSHYPGIVYKIKLFIMVLFLLSLATCTAWCQTLLEVTRMMRTKHEHCKSPHYTTLVIPTLLHHYHVLATECTEWRSTTPRCTMSFGKNGFDYFCFNRSHPFALFNILKKRFIESWHNINIQSIIHSFGYVFRFIPNHLQASIYYMEVHAVCTCFMGSCSVHTKSCQFKISISSIQLIDRMYF